MGPARNDSRAEQVSGRHLCTPPQQLSQVATHIANSSHAIGDEHRKRTIHFCEVDMHVPKSGDEKLSSPIDDLCSTWWSHSAGFTDSLYLISRDEHSHVSA
jgi:hypothetical protein